MSSIERNWLKPVQCSAVRFLSDQRPEKKNETSVTSVTSVIAHRNNVWPCANRESDIQPASGRNALFSQLLYSIAKTSPKHGQHSQSEKESAMIVSSHSPYYLLTRHVFMEGKTISADPTPDDLWNRHTRFKRFTRFTRFTRHLNLLVFRLTLNVDSFSYFLFLISLDKQTKKTNKSFDDNNELLAMSSTDNPLTLDCLSVDESQGNPAKGWTHRHWLSRTLSTLSTLWHLRQVVVLAVYWPSSGRLGNNQWTSRRVWTRKRERESKIRV